MKYNFDEIIDRRNTNSENVEGWKPYIFGATPDQEFPFADEEYIRMWVADMEFAVAPEIRQAIKDRVDKKILGYSMVFDEAYYEALENWCKTRYGYVYDREALVFSPGIIPALYQFAENLISDGEKILTMTPAYGFFQHACEYIDAELVTSPMKCEEGHFSLDREDFAAKAMDPAVKMIFLCNPHNPTGHIWTEEELQFMADIARKRNIWMISDEIHCDLLRVGKQHTTMGKIMGDYNKLAVCMSASKTFNLAGMMFSEIYIMDPVEREKFQMRDKLVGGINPLSIEAHKAAFSQGGPWLEALKAYLDETMNMVKSFLEENLPEAVYEIGDSTYFAWVDLSKYLPDIDYLPDFFANEAGVLLEGDNKLFVGNAQGYVRLNLAMPRSIIETGLDRILTAIKKHKA